MPAIIHWKEDSLEKSAPWWSEKGAVQPKKVVIGGDNFSAEKVIRLASQGIAILWRGDFHNAKQLMQAIARRLDKRDRKTGSEEEKESSKIFYKYRQVRLQRARTLSAVLIPFGDDYLIPLKRAPDVREAIKQVRGLSGEGFVTPLSDLLGFISAFEWRKKGIEVSALAGLQSQRIYPHYGVFPPTRHDYVKLVADMPLPDSMESDSVAFDIGTGTGLLAAILVRRGVGRVIATDLMPRAIRCAQENFER
ncbi:MAG TPA: methyltransferase, partial [Rhodospirillaceae bacterium]|nr:methyltransferase [Rhodospirillaceae bacterium]